MNTYNYSTIFIFLCVFMFSCRDKNQKSADRLHVAFSSENKVIKSGNNCDLPDSLMTECAILEISRLKPVSVSNLLNKAISDTLDVYISSMIGECIYPENALITFGQHSLDSLSKIYFDQHSNFIKEFPDAAFNSWSIEISVDSVHQNSKIITLAINGNTYLGGAHPNSFTSYHNFDKSSGKTLTLSDIIKNKKAFLTIAEKEFRKNQEISDQQNLEEAGYFFEKGIYNLPTQFAITTDGLLLFYNNYEAAAYAVGQIIYTIPFEMMVGIIDLDIIK